MLGIFLTLNLKPMAIIRTTKMKHSLSIAIIQEEGLFYKGLQTTHFCIFLDTKTDCLPTFHDFCFWLFQQMNSIEGI